jgi:hypothetical protein
MSNYLNQLKETYKSMRQSPDHGAASNHKVLLILFYARILNVHQMMKS